MGDVKEAFYATSHIYDPWQRQQSIEYQLRAKGYSPEQARIAAQGAMRGDRMNYEDGYLDAIKKHRHGKVGLEINSFSDFVGLLLFIIFPAGFVYLVGQFLGNSDINHKKIWKAYLLLLLFPLGLHKYYLRNNKMGVTYTFTYGLLFVGAIYDLFTIPWQVAKFNTNPNRIVWDPFD